MADLVNPKLEPLTQVVGLRTWVKELEDLPNAVCSLVEAANRQEITPGVIFFEYCDDEWHVALFGED